MSFIHLSIHDYFNCSFSIYLTIYKIIYMFILVTLQYWWRGVVICLLINWWWFYLFFLYLSLYQQDKVYVYISYIAVLTEGCCHSYIYQFMIIFFFLSIHLSFFLSNLLSIYIHIFFYLGVMSLIYISIYV